jgi:hypothetical protein
VCLVGWSAAQELDLPLVTPSLTKNGNFSHGANFAVSAATALDVSFFKDTPIAGMLVLDTSLSVQLKWFESMKPSLCGTDQGNQLELFQCKRKLLPLLDIHLRVCSKRIYI